jgi:signal transduction histidine kinase
MTPPSSLEANLVRSDPHELEVRLPAALLERFTALLVANPPLPLLIEETFFGLEALFDLDCLLLYALEDEKLRPVAGAGRGALEDVQHRMTPIDHAADALWEAVETGVARFSQPADPAALSASLGFLHASSLAVLPLPGANGEVRGALVLARIQPSEWITVRQKTLIAASRIIAVNLERSLAHHPAPTAEGVALSNLSRLLDGVHSETQLRRAALEVLRPHLAGVSLAWARLERGSLRILEFDGNETLELHLRESELPDDDAILEAVMDDSVTCADHLSGGGRFSTLGITAWCAMPVRQGLALLALRQSRTSAWSDAEQRLLGAAGKTLTAGLERLRALEALMDARSRAEFLAGLSDALQSAMTAEAVCSTAMALLGPNVRAANILTLRLSRIDTQIRVTAMGVWGDVPALYSNHLRPEGVPLEMTKLTRRVFETRQPFYDKGYVREKDPERSKVALGLEPIFDAQGNVLAVFSVGRDPRLGDWKPSERELLFRAAATVGLALERAEVRAELEQSRHRAQVLAKLSDALQTARTAEDAADAAMSLLAPALKALNIITLKLERRDGGVYLRSMGVWGALPDPYSGYFKAPGVDINKTQVSKVIVETGKAWYDTAYSDQLISDLRERRVSVGMEPIKDSFGQVIALFSVGRDVNVGPWTDTDRDLMARAASTIGLSLERARNREELETRARALEEKTAEMEAFVFSVSHDLKSPMVSLEGMSTLLEEAVKLGDGTELDFFVSRLRANVQTMTGLVNGLLELSRVGRVDESVDAVDVSRVIQTVLSEREVAILVNRITVDTADTFPFITYSPERFYQLMSNLIGNAIKFLPEHAPNPRLEITWSAHDDHLEFRVADNGPGIPDHLKPKSLELFSRLNPNIEGTGVGLAMVKRILELNDGTLQLEDTPGGGLTVVFTVPNSRWVR